MSQPNEKVLTIPTRDFHALGLFQGVTFNLGKYHPLFETENFSFVSREEAENDPTRKQVIPYIIVKRGTQVLSYGRSKDVGESRLAGKVSIGTGGHINTDDDVADGKRFASIYARGVHRELYEELRLVGIRSHHVIGLVNDDSNDVGQVHLGVIHLINLHDFGGIEVVESAHKTPVFALPVDLLQFHHDGDIELETWSRLILESDLKNISCDTVHAMIPFSDLQTGEATA